MKIEIDITESKNGFNISSIYKDMESIRVGDLLNILHSLLKSTENSVGDYLAKNNIKLTKKNSTEVLSKLKLSDLSINK